jgi:hypothetical protein
MEDKKENNDKSIEEEKKELAEELYASFDKVTPLLIDKKVTIKELIGFIVVFMAKLKESNKEDFDIALMLIESVSFNKEE